MSGAFGWGGRDRRGGSSSRSSSTPTPSPSRGGFTKAKKAFGSPPPMSTPVTPKSSRPATQASIAGGVASRAADLANVGRVSFSLRPTKALKSTAKNVIIVALDATGSMGKWREDILKYLVLLYVEAQGFLGDDLEVLFITYGDLKFNDEIEVAQFGRGQELDTHLVSLNISMGGGHDEEESPEIVAYYLLQQVDVSSAKHVYTYFITDERAAATVDATLVRQNLDLSFNTEYRDTTSVFRALLRKMEVFLVLRKTDDYSYDYDRIRSSWEKMLGAERVLPLDLSNLVVEVMLAVIAKTTDQMSLFDQSFDLRRGATQFGATNRDLVGKSIALVPGTDPTAPPPAPKTALLVPASGDDALGDDKGASDALSGPK
jgi:hypothetical protein